MGIGRKCSQCGEKGHNSRTCRSLRNNFRTTPGIVKLFGVHLHHDHKVVRSSDESFEFMRTKSLSMPSLFTTDHTESPDYKLSNGYLSDGLATPRIPLGCRKKGVAWSEEEHRLFLLGLQKLGKGDWKGISTNFVITRSPSQIASHAQKYFLRQRNKFTNYINAKIRNQQQNNWSGLVDTVGRNQPGADQILFSSDGKMLNKPSDIGRKLDCNISSMIISSSSCPSNYHHNYLKGKPAETAISHYNCRSNVNINANPCRPSLELTLASPHLHS